MEDYLLVAVSQLGYMDGKASVHHQHDIPSKQAMIYLLTMGWPSAHTSLAMTPEQSATSGDHFVGHNDLTILLPVVVVNSSRYHSEQIFFLNLAKMNDCLNSLSLSPFFHHFLEAL